MPAIEFTAKGLALKCRDPLVTSGAKAQLEFALLCALTIFAAWPKTGAGAVHRA